MKERTVYELARTRRIPCSRVTGLQYVQPEVEDLHEHLEIVETTLNQLAKRELCPGAAELERLNASLR